MIIFSESEKVQTSCSLFRLSGSVLRSITAAVLVASTADTGNFDGFSRGKLPRKTIDDFAILDYDEKSDSLQYANVTEIMQND